MDDIMYDPELEEMLENTAFEELHPCAVKNCISGPWEVSDMGDDFYVTTCFFGHETIWTRENQP